MHTQSAIYAGSFDPIHNGHLNVINRASRLFDLTVLVASNPSKQPLFNAHERVEMIRRLVDPAVKVVALDNGLVADYAVAEGCPTLIKGVRNFADFDYERMIHELSLTQQAGIETLFLPAVPCYNAISSGAIKELVRLNGSVANMTPVAVIKQLQLKLHKMVLIGVTGGIGSGKSTFCRNLVQHSYNPRFIHLDLDAVVAQVWDEYDRPGIQQMFQRVAEQLDVELADEPARRVHELKAAVKHRLFNVRDQGFSAWLSAELGPHVLRKFREFLSSHRCLDQTTVLVESALLCEASLTSWVNHCVVVMNNDNDEARMRRLLNRGMTKDDALDRISMQWTDTRRHRWLVEDVKEAGFGGIAFSSAENLIQPEDRCEVIRKKLNGLVETINPLIQL